MSNWQKLSDRSNYHFDWQRQEPHGFDYRWLGRFEGDWSAELEHIKQVSEPKSWRSRGKKYAPQHPELDDEEADLINAGMDVNQTIYRKHFDFEGPFARMLEETGLVDTKQAFHIQYPGEMLNLHIDKQYEMNENPLNVARFFVFLEDWKPGHFLQMGTSFIQWRKGDIIHFDWKNTPHASANAGWDPRCLCQITGTITQKTVSLMSGNRRTIEV